MRNIVYAIDLHSCEHTDCIVVYVGTECPMCEMEKKIERLEADIKNLNEFD